MKKKSAKGFTLIELMIVVAIVGILGAIALPSYQNSVRKGKRAQARAALTDLMLQQERYMTQMNTYLAFTNTAGTTSPASVPFKTFSGDSSTDTAYYLSAAACTGTTIKECVVVTAAPVTPDPEAGSLQILSSGTKTCTGTNTTVCWK